ncbi:MAG: alpha-galactosidase [Lachnospiraceae bacterium]
MGIKYFEESNSWKLDTPETSYIICAADQERFLLHAYSGKKISDQSVAYLTRIDEAPFVPSVNNRDRGSFLDSAPMEYPTYGVGDFRESCIEIETEGGHHGLSLLYKSHRIYGGKPKLQGLPATFGDEDDCTTLELTIVDNPTGLEAVLVYTVFEKHNVITRSVRIKNGGLGSLYLKRALSVCLDMDNQEYDLITLHGSWARERRIYRRKIGYGKQVVSSLRGESSHQEHPFLAFADKHTTQESGEIYGLSFVYSGNFIAATEGNQFDGVRVVMGINPAGFSWKLMPGEEFITPEVVMVYSSTGIDRMSQTFHDLYREHLIRSPFKDKKRPILINNWEATYFEFDTEKLIAIAREAKQNGIEMLVMDDGWFGNRSSDNMALGDWYVNEEKIKGGLGNLVEEVNRLGMEFGIWIEPEMISPDSDLYRAHPDWAIQIPNRTATLLRNQYVLDFSRPEIVDAIYQMISEVLRSANITYVKWDMNRQLCDIGSIGLPADRQGELMHRYMLGVYDMQERLVHDFPYILLENCSGGGARFDAGMLYYSPQIWCSDDTDAIERLSIQEGTALVYPLSAMGAHVSDCPNHTVGRSTPFETRGYVALAGTFGYELDVTKISEADRSIIPKQVEMYHAYNEIVRTGDYYRIASYSENGLFDCWEVVRKDHSEALVTFIQVLGRPNVHSRRIRLKGLEPDKRYQVSCEKDVLCIPAVNKSGAGFALYGDTLMNAGISIGGLTGDFVGALIAVKEVR